MFSILKQFRASNALDARHPGRTNARNKPSEFAQLDIHLRTTAPAHPEADGLHQSIMRAVNAASATDAPAKPGLSWAWTSASLALAAACVALIVWPGSKSMSPRVASVPSVPFTQPPMTAASTALALGGSWTATLPAAITAPMTDELDRLNKDIVATTRTLLATLP